jgi:hypothetical protein
MPRAGPGSGVNRAVWFWCAAGRLRAAESRLSLGRRPGPGAGRPGLLFSHQPRMIMIVVVGGRHIRIRFMEPGSPPARRRSRVRVVAGQPARGRSADSESDFGAGDPGPDSEAQAGRRSWNILSRPASHWQLGEGARRVRSHAVTVRQSLPVTSPPAVCCPGRQVGNAAGVGSHAPRLGRGMRTAGGPPCLSPDCLGHKDARLYQMYSFYHGLGPGSLLIKISLVTSPL